MSQTKIEPLNNAEKEWISRQIKLACEFVERHSSADADKPLTLQALDRAWAEWIGSDPKDGEAINAVINSVGISFGSFLVTNAKLEWGVGTDEFGTEMVLHGEPGEILIYPANLIAKRWEKRETHFITDAHDKIVAHVAAVRSQHLN